jgi:hypothetical protein
MALAFGGFARAAEAAYDVSGVQVTGKRGAPRTARVSLTARF